jgi:hypothetical protein
MEDIHQGFFGSKLYMHNFFSAETLFGCTTGNKLNNSFQILDTRL